MSEQGRSLCGQFQYPSPFFRRWPRVVSVLICGLCTLGSFSAVAPFLSSSLLHAQNTDRLTQLTQLWKTADSTGNVASFQVGHLLSTNDRPPDTKSPKLLTLRLRITWGGVSPTQWAGNLQVDQGRFHDLQPLGLEGDVPGSFYTEGNKVVLDQRSPKTYDGFDVTITSFGDRQLSLQLMPTAGQGGPVSFKVPLRELLEGEYRSPLDEENNQLVIRRAPGDRLRVRLHRDHLIFAPQEKLSLDLLPYECGLQENSSIRCELQIYRAGTDELLNSVTRQMILPADTLLFKDLLDWQLSVPDQEGVYDLRISIYEKSFISKIVGQTPPITSRKIQFVVLAKPSIRSSQGLDWQTVYEIEPSQSKKNWGWSFSRLSTITDNSTPPFSHGDPKTQERPNGTFMTLSPGSWQVLPLKIHRLGQPHYVEIEYPSDQAQTLSISLLETNTAGQLLPIQLDSSIIVEPSSQTSSKRHVHRILFWPKTQEPWLRLLNTQTEKPATYGTVRVLAGPTTLPKKATSNFPVLEERLIAAFFEKPLFAENFSAKQGLDPTTFRSLDDWTTFYQGATRLAEYLNATGFNGAIIPVYCEGSTLYPSQIIESVPKYDTGTFFSTGQDPIQKDVLELLFRIFDREGLTLVPALHFATPLPALEEQILGQKRLGQNPKESGILLLSDRGLTWEETFSKNQGLAASYNPLNHQVQSAVEQVCDELISRYQNHRSFGGLTLLMTPECYTHLPDENWALDPTTLFHFFQENSLSLKSNLRLPLSEEAKQLVLQENKEAWLAWRSKKLNDLYSRISQRLQRGGGFPGTIDRRLYLSGVGLSRTLPLQRQLQPTLPDQRPPLHGAFLDLGLDFSFLQNDPSICFLLPYHVALNRPVSQQAVEYQLQKHLADSPDLQKAQTRGGILYYEPEFRPLATFDEKSPLDDGKTVSYLATQHNQTEEKSREYLAKMVAQQDLQVMAVGGWMLPLGQEEAISPFYEVFRTLPKTADQTVQRATFQKPITIRIAEGTSHSTLYLVNPMPWPVSLQIQFKDRLATQIRSQSGRNLPPLIQHGTGTSWHLQLEPYELVSAQLGVPRFEIAKIETTLPPQLSNELHQELTFISGKLNHLLHPTPLPLLTNPDFELPPETAKVGTEADILGWTHALGNDHVFGLDQGSAQQGESALKIHSKKGGAWIRSQTIPVPASGRLAMWAWVKNDLANGRPPQLRLSLEGNHRGTTYYRFATVRQPENQSPQEWIPYLFQIDEIPQDLTDLKVGFDLMDEGTVWIDNVQLFDTWLQNHERAAFSKMVGLAHFQLNQGDLANCLETLDSYWPRYIRDSQTESGSLYSKETTKVTERDSPQSSAHIAILQKMTGYIFPFH
ncbi:MAG: family 10 glycosylhydrolase [Pirellulaceae bacterium]|nr:family 10 glycosylhydrolase [Pirellulaceae bacterium]